MSGVTEVLREQATVNQEKYLNPVLKDLCELYLSAIS